MELMCEHGHYYPCKRPEYKHIHDQVSPVGVYESVSYDPMPLVAFYHVIWFEAEVVEYCSIVKTHDRYCDSKEYDKCTHVVYVQYYNKNIL